MAGEECFVKRHIKRKENLKVDCSNDFDCFPLSVFFSPSENFLIDLLISKVFSQGMGGWHLRYVH